MNSKREGNSGDSFHAWRSFQIPNMDKELLGPAVFSKASLMGEGHIFDIDSSRNTSLNSYLGRVSHRPLKGSVIVLNFNMPGTLSTRYTEKKVRHARMVAKSLHLINRRN